MGMGVSPPAMSANYLQCLRRPEEGVRSPGSALPDGWSCPVGAGDRTPVLCKSGTCF